MDVNLNNDDGEHQKMITKNYLTPFFYSDKVPIKQRRILWYLVFAGFSVNYMIRCNLNIAIIDMVDPSHLKKSSGVSNISNECFKNDEENYKSIDIDTVENRSSDSRSFYSLEQNLLQFLSVILKPTNYNF